MDLLCLAKTRPLTSLLFPLLGELLSDLPLSLYSTSLSSLWNVGHRISISEFFQHWVSLRPCCCLCYWAVFAATHHVPQAALLVGCFNCSWRIKAQHFLIPPAWDLLRFASLWVTATLTHLFILVTSTASPQSLGPLLPEFDSSCLLRLLLFN